MKEDPRSLRPRLFFYPPLEGKPPWVLIACVKHLGVAIARMWLENRGAESLTSEYPIGADFLRRATEDAKADIAALGHSPVSSSVDGYLDEIDSWFHYDFSDEALTAAIRAAEDAAPPELLERLPGHTKRSPRGYQTQIATLSRDRMERWRGLVSEIVGIRLWHERAVATRPEYIRLAKARGLPAHDIFLEGLGARLRELLKSQGTVEKVSLERLVGACAARASAWRLGSLRWELEVADLRIAPLGSYLNDSKEPKSFQIWRVLDARLRSLLGTSMSNFAKSRILSVALKVYAGSELAPIADIDGHATNTVEKLRRRMPPALEREAKRQILMEEHPVVIGPVLPKTPSRMRRKARPDATAERVSPTR